MSNPPDTLKAIHKRLLDQLIQQNPLDSIELEKMIVCLHPCKLPLFASEEQWVSFQESLEKSLKNDAFQRWFKINYRKLAEVTIGYQYPLWICQKAGLGYCNLIMSLPYVRPEFRYAFTRNWIMNENFILLPAALSEIIQNLNDSGSKTLALNKCRRAKNHQDIDALFDPINYTWNLDDFKDLLEYGFQINLVPLEGNKWTIFQKNLLHLLQNNDEFKAFFNNPENFYKFCAIAKDPKNNAWIASQDPDGLTLEKLYQLSNKISTPQDRWTFTQAYLQNPKFQWESINQTPTLTDSPLNPFYWLLLNSGYSLDNSQNIPQAIAFTRIIAERKPARAAVEKFLSKPDRSHFNKDIMSIFEATLNAYSPWHCSRFIYPSLIAVSVPAILIILDRTLELDCTSGYEAALLVVSTLFALSVLCYRMAPRLQDPSQNIMAHIAMYSAFIFALGLCAISIASFADADIAEIVWGDILACNDTQTSIAQSFSLLAAPWVAFEYFSKYHSWNPGKKSNSEIGILPTDKRGFIWNPNEEARQEKIERRIYGSLGFLLGISALLITLDQAFDIPCSTGCEGFVMIGALTLSLGRFFYHEAPKLIDNNHPLTSFGFKIGLLFSLVLTAISISAACDISFAETLFETALNSPGGATGEALTFSTVGAMGVTSAVAFYSRSSTRR